MSALTRWTAAAAARDLGLGTAVLTGTAGLSVLLVRASGRAWRAVEWAGAGRESLEGVLVGAVTGLGALTATWYALSALLGVLCALAGLVGGTWRAGEEALRRHGAPGIARLVGAGTGAVLATGLALSPVQAEPPAPSPEPTLAEDLTWAAAATGGENDGAATTPPAPPAEAPSTPDAASDEPTAAPATSADEPAAAPAGSTGEPAAAPAGSTGEPATEPASGAPRHTAGAGSSDDAAARGAEHVVQPGDTLWSIAAGRLRPGADDAQIAAAWPRWYAANAEVIGPDPDLILPGTVLTPPD